MKTDFTKLPIGTKVWDITKGWGVIERICHDQIYPILVKHYVSSISYTAQGKAHTWDIHPSLFLNKFKIPDEAYIPPRPYLKVDDKVIVWNTAGQKKQCRHFKCWDSDGRICMF